LQEAWILSQLWCKADGGQRCSIGGILPHQPMRQWVLGNCSRHGSTSHIHVVVSVPFPLRFVFASNPKVMSGALAIVYRTIATHLGHKSGFANPLAQTGAVTLIQRFGSALNLNIPQGTFS
jgi:hypothetical protein